MPKEHRPWFRIYRIDRPPSPDDEAPDTHYQAFWKIHDKTYRVQICTKDEAEQLPSEAQPPEAKSLDGRGWMVLKPIEMR
jgi:hypothetical protein